LNSTQNRLPSIQFVLSSYSFLRFLIPLSGGDLSYDNCPLRPSLMVTVGPHSYFHFRCVRDFYYHYFLNVMKKI